MRKTPEKFAETIRLSANFFAQLAGIHDLIAIEGLSINLVITLESAAYAKSGRKNYGDP
jgi:hypothetical protein